MTSSSPLDRTPREAGLPAKAYTAALLTLPDLGPYRLDALLDHFGSAAGAWEALKEGRKFSMARTGPDTVASWRVAARKTSPEELWEQMLALDMSVVEFAEPGYPHRLLEDPEPPRLLFAAGHAPTGPSVAIVGTRNCTAYGQRCAFELGSALASSGVSVVSGLALGIDTAAHRGALSAAADRSGGAAPIGVVGCGLDVVYPKRNASLWEQIRTQGWLLSESAPGVQPARWRFPARNRIIAGLSDAVVVVESHEKGGSLLTADEALARDVPIGVVPGPITTSSTRGSNRLLAEGATPVLGVDDVLALVGVTPPATSVVETTSGGGDDSSLLDALGWQPLLLEQVCQRVAGGPAQVAAELERLVIAGAVKRNGPWIERVR